MIGRVRYAPLHPARLRWLLALFFLALAIPAAVLIVQAHGQLELDALRRQQLLADEVYRRIDDALAAAVQVEDARAVEDYRFAGGAGGPGTVVRRSALSAFPPSGPVPGLIGYFQVNAEGALSTPLLPDRDFDPAAHGMPAPEYEARRALHERLLRLLARNRLVGVRRVAAQERLAFSDAPPPARGQAAFDRLAEAAPPVQEQRREPVPGAAQSEPGRADAARADAAGADAARTGVADDAGGAESAADARVAESARIAADTAAAEQTQPGAAAAARDGTNAAAAARDGTDATAAGRGGADAAAAEQAAAEQPAEAERADEVIATFRSEVEPLRFSRLDTGEFVLFRNAWRDGARYVQGALIDQREFLHTAIGAKFDSGGLAPGSGLVVTAGTDELLRLDGAAARESLHAARLSPPFGALELGFVAGELPRGPAYGVLVWTAIALFSVLIGGFAAMYRFAMLQILLARQQHDFVSAVSHELRTPLTSIRMYAEMLKSGWTSEEKRQTYYGFIFAEGERLSRLIDNVLRMARLDRGGDAVVLERLTVGEAVDMIRSKVAAQAEQAGMDVRVEADPAAVKATVEVDPDALAQVFINLVDNAIKFTHDAERREIVISVRPGGAGHVVFGVRDFGPGLPHGDMKRLFRLFYRPDDERTRNAAGTGIGLALVRQLVSAMRGTVEVRNREPGAEFRITFQRGDNDG